ncbi:MAG: ASKHA domain-containing protein, partial [Brooklawnia sp.]
IQVDAYGGRQLAAPLRSPGRYGIAVDIGSTTVVVALVDLDSLAVVGTVSRLNPQARYGADVLSRITHATSHGVEGLQLLIIEALGDAIGEAARQAGIALDLIDRITICGNTTMMYLLRGIDPTPLSVFPFTADHISMLTQDAATNLGIEALGECELVLLPGISAYVGADITAGLYFIGADEFSGTPKLLVDIGTNGEIAFILDDEIVCTATAAGPAFEGASISCGVGSIEGAINMVWTDDGQVKYSTIANKPAVGVCGSAIVDLLVWGLESEQIKPSGRMPDPLELPDTPVPITLDQNDIRSLQLAKAAIRTGMQMMLGRTGVAPYEVRELLIAGGFGRYLNKANAARIGLLPASALDRMTALGNAALGGAILALYDPDFEDRCARIISHSRAVDLSSQPEFNSLFISNIAFRDPTDTEALL